MIETVTILRTSLKEGVTKTNKPYVQMGIQTNKHPGKWLSCFLNDFNKVKLTALKEGQQVDILVTANGDFLNFTLPTKTDLLEARVAKLESIVLNSHNATAPTAISSMEKAVEEWSNEPDPEDINF